MGVPVVSFIIRRLKTSRLLSEIVLATTVLPEDDRVAEIGRQEAIGVYRGSSEDVLGRYVKAAENRGFDHAVRVTGDCPFVDGETLDYVLESCLREKTFDLMTTKPAFPHGVDYEVYPTRVLKEIDAMPALPSSEREHILNHVYDNAAEYRIKRLTPPPDLVLDETIFLLDTREDYDRMQLLLAGETDPLVRPSHLIRKHLHSRNS